MTMFAPTLALFTLTLMTSLSNATTNTTNDNIGASGMLSSLDGGLGGLVTVTNASALTITSYTLADASAPALYWWGTTDGVIKDGFRISNEQVTQAATSNILVINLDAGKTSADFNTVGLWCERLNADFGQATLTAATVTSAGGSSTTSASTTVMTSTKSGVANTIASPGVIVVSFLVAASFAMLMG